MKCTFCGKDRKDVEDMVPTVGAAICNECVDLAKEIIEFKKNLNK